MKWRPLVISCGLAVGAPAGAALWTSARLADLEDHMSQAAGMPVRIGTVDVGLTGTVRVSDVALGDIIAIDGVEAGVSMASLLDGALRADEIVVERPRLELTFDSDGDSNGARLMRRLLSARGRAAAGAGPVAGGGPGESSIRRIVVAGGQLVARIAGVGEVAARELAVEPHQGSARVVMGHVTVHSERADATFDRVSADVATPTLRLVRALAIGGTAAVRVSATATAEPVKLRELAVLRRAPTAPVELTGWLDDHGAARRWSIAATRERATVEVDQVPLAPFAALAPVGLDVAKTRATGNFEVRREHDGVVVVVDGQLADLTIDHPGFAPGPVAMSPRLAGAMSWRAGTLVVSQASVALGALSFEIAGWLKHDHHSPPAAQLDVDLHDRECGELLGGLPEKLRGPLDGMVAHGSLGAHARLAVDLAAAAGSGVAISLTRRGTCEVIAEPPAADVTTLQRRPGDHDHDPAWVSLTNVPSYVRAAFISAEDGRFYQHPGFDLEQIGKSLEINLREGKLLRGGSTISQQLVKNAFLTQRRSIDRKIQEAALTWRLEQRLDKRQIFERYLNIIELGPRIWGLRAAARHWFGVSPRELSIKQAAFLAALTSQPGSMTRRIRKHGGLDAISEERINVILYAMRRDGALTDETYHAARATQLSFATGALPD